VTTPKDRAKMASDENIKKAIDKANARDRDTKRNWSGRGTSGDEIANKEYEKRPQVYQRYDHRDE
jgi:hypothetical protein